jgi:hypothetical protein
LSSGEIPEDVYSCAYYAIYLISWQLLDGGYVGKRGERVFMSIDTCQAIYTKRKSLTKIPKNYWVLGLFPSSGILGTRKHDASKVDVSVLGCRGEDT